MAAAMQIAGDAKNSVVLFSSVNETQVADNEKFATPCHGTPKKSMIGQSCTHCILCHLAGALALAVKPVMPQVAPTHVFSAALNLSKPSFIPNLLIPPPRPPSLNGEGLLKRESLADWRNTPIQNAARYYRCSFRNVSRRGLS